MQLKRFEDFSFNDHSTNEASFHLSQKFNYSLNEDNTYVPRFALKDIAMFKNIEVNKPLKYDERLLIKAIEYGMIFYLDYKGAEDTNYSGHGRVIYPMVLGLSAKGKKLLRGYHLKGWSVSGNGKVEKIWRMFRTDRILNMTFTGSFYRLPPEGYNMEDKGMRGGIIIAADFEKIRKNQEILTKQDLIQNKKEIVLSQDMPNTPVEVKVEKTDSILDLTNALDNPYVANVANIDGMRINFLKSTVGNKYLALIGGLAETGNKIILFDTKGKLMGAYKVLDSVEVSKLKNIKRVKGNNNYDVYIFKNKIGEEE